MAIISWVNKLQNVYLLFNIYWLPSLWLILIDTFSTPGVNYCCGNDGDMYIYAMAHLGLYVIEFSGKGMFHPIHNNLPADNHQQYRKQYLQMTWT